MPRYAVIQSGTVVNVIEAEAVDATANGWVLIPSDKGVGDTYNGSTFSDAVVSELVPRKVTMRQGRLALLDAALLSTVNTLIATQAEDIQIYWEYSTELERNHPVIESLKAPLSLTDTQLDALFIAAGKK